MTEDERCATVVRLLPLLRRTAVRIAQTSPLELDDLIGEGALGLVRAVDTWDARRGVSLESYARHCIAFAIYNGMRRYDPVPERTRRILRDAERARYDAAAGAGRVPSLVELERNDPALREARSRLARFAPYSREANSAGEGLAGEEASTETRALQAVGRSEIRSAVTRLTPRERTVVALHYARSLSLRAIARHLGLSPQRISQLHAAALARLRNALRAA